MPDESPKILIDCTGHDAADQMSLGKLYVVLLADNLGEVGPLDDKGTREVVLTDPSKFTYVKGLVRLYALQTT